MVVEPVIAGRVRLWSLRAVPEEPQSGQTALHRGAARPKSALDTDGIGGQSQPGGCDACRPARLGFVDNEPVGGVRLMYEIAKGIALQRFQFRVTDRRST